MKLSLLQSTLAATLRADPALAGVPVIENTGQPARHADLEAPLREQGVEIVVSPPLLAEVRSQSARAVGLDVRVLISVRYNHTVCTSSHGLKKNYWDIIEAAILAVKNLSTGPGDPPFKLTEGSGPALHLSPDDEGLISYDITFEKQAFL